MASSSKPIIKIHDLSTGEETERQMTQKEYDEHLSNIAQADAVRAEREAKETARQSALEKLAALGLTSEEIQALAGN